MSQIAPVIELRGIKRTAWASEETHCYQATLYVDGEKWGTVSNQGHGGCDVVELEAEVAALRISDSLDMDWRPIDAARAIIAGLEKETA